MYPALLSAAMLCVVVVAVLAGRALAQSPGTEKENMVLSMPIQVTENCFLWDGSCIHNKDIKTLLWYKVFGHVRLFHS